MKAYDLKTEALCWLRFAKQLDFVCTEVGVWNADVIGACQNYSIEVEVKVNRADLLSEFRNKKPKHTYYGFDGNWTPNYFYFLVPKELGESTVETVKEKFPKAGVLAYALERGRPGEHLVCLRRPTKLHGNKPSRSLLHAIKRRMGSELCGLHVALDKLKSNVGIGQIEDLKKQIVEAIVASHGAEDWEKPALDVGQQAAEIAGDSDACSATDEASVAAPDEATNEGK